LPYLSSKFLVLSAVTVGQALLLMVLVYGTLEVLQLLPFGLEAPPSIYQLAYPEQFGVLALLAMTGVALGLLLSACVSTPDRANALLPYVLIPQIILGGGIMPVKGGVLEVLAMLLSPVYWAYRAIHRGADQLPRFISYHMDYADNALLPCAVLVAELVLLLGATAWCLRQKDVNRA
jgi:ABC-2 type transporter